MKIEKYRPELEKSVIRMIQHTIRTVNQRDYEPAQIMAWSDLDETKWAASLVDRTALVMMTDEYQVAGFGDMTAEGYLDRLYTAAAYQGIGIGGALLAALEQQSSSRRFSTYASITARPFFEAHGYQVVRENIAKVRGQEFLNVYMEKEVSDD